MATFVYKARDINKKLFRGGFEARDSDDAMQKLRERNLFVLNLKEKTVRKQRFTMKSKQLAEFCKELALMLHSGLPIVKALNVISNGDATDKRIRVVYQELHKSIKTGMALSEAMTAQGKTFPELIVNMFYSGEISGTLSDVSEKMSDYYTSDYKLKKKISQATTYPKILCVMIVAVLLIVFLFVLPTILDMLEGQELPVVTQIMKNFSEYIVNKWYNVVMFVFGGFLIFSYLKSIKAIRYHLHKMILKLPKIGLLLKIIYTARFARTLSSLYGSGVHLVTAIGIASKIIGNTYIEAQFPDVVKKIKQGESMSEVLAQVDGFSGKLQNILVIGEETGKLDDILTFAANSFEYDADAAITGLLGLMEPIMLVVIAVIVCMVVMSVLLPIFQMYDTMGSYGGI